MVELKGEVVLDSAMVKSDGQRWSHGLHEAAAMVELKGKVVRDSAMV